MHIPPTTHIKVYVLVKPSALTAPARFSVIFKHDQQQMYLHFFFSQFFLISADSGKFTYSPEENMRNTYL